MSNTIEYVRPWLYPKQQAAIFAPERYSVIEASTKSGKTHGCIVWLFEQALAGKDGQNFWWVAPVYPQARIAYSRLKNDLRKNAPGLYKPNDTDMTITLVNGTVVWFKTGEKPDNLYGEDVYAAVIDEASRVREESWHAIRSTLTATRGPLRIIGNVKGRKNWAYTLARKAEGGAPDMAYARLTAWDAIESGVLALAEVEDAREQLPEAVFRELYEAEPSDDEGNPFGVDAIKSCVGALSSDDPFAWGWDLAKSVDYTVGVALDESGAVCGFQRFQRSWEDTIQVIRRTTGEVPAEIDSTGVGDPVVEKLQKGRTTITGFKFTASTKQQLMEGLAVAIQQHEVTYPDGPIVAELMAFEYEYTRTGVRYSAPEGMHDDCVVALALAVHCWAARKRRPVAISVAPGILNQRPSPWSQAGGGL